MKHSNRLARGGLAAMLAMLVLVSVQGRWLMAAMLVVLLAPSLFVTYWPHGVRRAYIALFVLAMTATSAAYVLNGFARVNGLDKLVHFYSGFVVTLVFGLMLYESVLDVLARRRLLLAAAVFSVGASIAVLWEIAEWLLDRYVAARIIRGLMDAMTDLIAGLAGALLASLIAAFRDAAMHAARIVRKRTDQSFRQG